MPKHGPKGDIHGTGKKKRRKPKAKPTVRDLAGGINDALVKARRRPRFG